MRGGVTELPGNVAPPLALKHQGQAVHHDVEEAAHEQPQQRQDPGREQQLQGLAGQITAPSLKMGKYIAITMPPMSTPSTTMMKGSIKLASPLTISSTSLS